MRQNLYRRTTPAKQGSLWFSYAELGLDIKKMYVTEEKFPDLYSTTGFINLGDSAHFHENAKILAMRVLKDVDSLCLFFVPFTEKPFICYKDENDKVVLKVVGYFDYAKDVFKNVNWDNDYRLVGLIEEIDPQKWDIIEK